MVLTPSQDNHLCPTWAQAQSRWLDCVGSSCFELLERWLRPGGPVGEQGSSENKEKSNPSCIMHKNSHTLLAFGRQSKMEKTSFALPSGSFGRKTPTASTSIWYKQLEKTGSGSSRRYSFSKPAAKRLSGSCNKSSIVQRCSAAGKNLNLFIERFTVLLGRVLLHCSKQKRAVRRE